MIPTLFLTGLLSLAPLEQQSFPDTLVESAAGHFKPGGMVALQLKPGVSVKVDNRLVTTDNGLAVFGYGRDAGKETTLKFSVDGQDYAVIRPLEKRDYNVQYVWLSDVFLKKRREGIAYLQEPRQALRSRSRSKGHRPDTQQQASSRRTLQVLLTVCTHAGTGTR